MNTEQENFEEWVASKGRYVERYVMSLWAGSSATMPTYRDNWIEAQWIGWKARARLEKPNPWKAAIDDALVNSGLDCIGDETPKQALARLIEWEIEIALDPAVSSRAKALTHPEQQAPVGYLYQHDETGRTTFRDELDPNMGPRWYAIPLYVQPIK